VISHTLFKELATTFGLYVGFKMVVVIKRTSCLRRFVVLDVNIAIVDCLAMRRCVSHASLSFQTTGKYSYISRIVSLLSHR
jgi:hypothetical protein